MHYLAVFCTFSYGREWVISDKRPPCDISKTRANLKKLMSDSDSAPLKTPETSLTLPAKNIVLTSVIYAEQSVNFELFLLLLLLNCFIHI